MPIDKEILKNKLVEELKFVVAKLGKVPYRKDFIRESRIPTSKKEIEKLFTNNYTGLCEKAGYKAPKSGKVETEDMLAEYHRLVKFTGEFPLTRETIDKNSKYRYSLFKKRFKGLKNASKEYAIKYRVSSLAANNIKTSPKSTGTKAQVSEKVDRAYTGYGAEFIVTGQLLSKGFNSNRLPIDTGIDVIAVNKNNKLFLIQIKSTHFISPSQSSDIKLTKSSYENNIDSNVYYIFLMWIKGRSNEDYLILPQSKITELIKKEKIQTNSKGNLYLIKVYIEDSKVFLNEKTDMCDVSTYFNDWSVLT